MLSRLMTRWRGIALSLIGIVAIVWLAATGQLGLYIHPRYFEFTVIMAVLAGVVVIAAFAVVPAAAAHDDAEHADAEHDDAEPAEGVPPRRRRRDFFWGVAAAAVIVGTATALLVLPPETLTTATVEQRDLNASAAVTDSGEALELVGADTLTFTIKDWASLLRQGAGEEYFAGKTASISGFVTPDPDDPGNVFYIARFVVTCCAVDAQPVGVPVYLPEWEKTFPVDSWVSAKGGFGANPSTSSTQAIVLQADDLEAIEQPADPYVY